jgi:telomeric repeat-binding factor 2
MELAAGEERGREILGKLEEPASHVNPISTPEVNKVIHALKSRCADLHSVVEDPLPAAKAAADEVLAARMDKTRHIVAEEVNNRAANSSVAGSSAVNDQGEVLRKGTPSNIMDWNPTARSFHVSFLCVLFVLIFSEDCPYLIHSEQLN